MQGEDGKPIPVSTEDATLGNRKLAITNGRSERVMLTKGIAQEDIIESGTVYRILLKIPAIGDYQAKELTYTIKQSGSIWKILGWTLASIVGLVFVILMIKSVWGSKKFSVKDDKDWTMDLDSNITTPE